MLARGQIVVDGSLAREVQQLIGEFTHVILDGQVLQANTPMYLMMNKPAGVVSATKDERHKTVVDCLDTSLAEELREALHLVGRLDYNSTGLILLTNDGRWSRQVTAPENKIAKIYRVTLANPVTSECADEYVDAFASGMYFPYEGITTQPAKLHMLDQFTAEVHLLEGRYHQIKRMFGRFQNPVLTLHRSAIGNIQLDPALAPGASRVLRESEVTSFEKQAEVG